MSPCDTVQTGSFAGWRGSWRSGAMLVKRQSSCLSVGKPRPRARSRAESRSGLSQGCSGPPLRAWRRASSMGGPVIATAFKNPIVSALFQFEGEFLAAGAHDAAASQDVNEIRHDVI